jgi:DNA repair photolyase
VAELTKAGIRAGVLIAPLMPGVNDSSEQVEEIVDLALEAGAAYVTPITLHLRGEVRDLWFEWLKEHRPDLIPRYERLYRRSAYAPRAEQARIAALVKGSDAPAERRLRGRLTPLEKREKPVRKQEQGRLF